VTHFDSFVVLIVWIPVDEISSNPVNPFVCSKWFGSMTQSVIWRLSCGIIGRISSGVHSGAC
jgi:hypothetical protein